MGSLESVLSRICILFAYICIPDRNHRSGGWGGVGADALLVSGDRQQRREVQWEAACLLFFPRTHMGVPLLSLPQFSARKRSWIHQLQDPE